MRCGSVGVWDRDFQILKKFKSDKLLLQFFFRENIEKNASLEGELKECYFLIYFYWIYYTF